MVVEVIFVVLLVLVGYVLMTFTKQKSKNIIPHRWILNRLFFWCSIFQQAYTLYDFTMTTGQIIKLEFEEGESEEL